MYKCTDCGKIFELKQEYCDCGNNIFEEIIEEKTVTNKERKKQKIFKSDKKTFSQQYPEFMHFLKSFDIISIIIFTICIILSIFSLIFIGRENPKNEIKTKNKLEKQANNNNIKRIPLIDAIWDNTPVEEKKPQIEEEKQQQKQNIQETVKKSKQTINKSQKKTQNIIKEKTKPAPTKNNVNELNNYKSALRQALFVHLSLSAITGSGKCEVEFNIDKSGKLLNRKFSKLSDNTSLNDAVYAMMMNLPQYYPPPSSYKGEKLRLSYYFNDGYYEIEYK